MAVNTDKDVPEDDIEGMLTPPQGGHVPFDGRAQVVAVPGDVNGHQLIEEVYAHLGDRSAYEVVLTGDDSDQKLYVLGDTDMDAVRGVVDAHTPDPDFGLSDKERNLRVLRERLVRGEELGNQELNSLLRTLF